MEKNTFKQSLLARLSSEDLWSWLGRSIFALAVLIPLSQCSVEKSRIEADLRLQEAPARAECTEKSGMWIKGGFCQIPQHVFFAPAKAECSQRGGTWHYGHSFCDAPRIARAASDSDRTE